MSDSLDSELRAWLMPQILLEQSNLCYYCKVEFNEYPMVPTFDHVVPRCLGGTDHPTNLVAACILCNVFKGHRTDIHEGGLIGAWPDWLIELKRKRRRVNLIPQGWVKAADNPELWIPTTHNTGGDTNE